MRLHYVPERLPYASLVADYALLPGTGLRPGRYPGWPPLPNCHRPNPGIPAPS